MSCAAKGIIGARRKRQCASTGVLFNHDVRALAYTEKMWLRPVVRRLFAGAGHPGFLTGKGVALDPRNGEA